MFVYFFFIIFIFFVHVFHLIWISFSFHFTTTKMQVCNVHAIASISSIKVPCNYTHLHTPVLHNHGHSSKKSIASLLAEPKRNSLIDMFSFYLLLQQLRSASVSVSKSVKQQFNAFEKIKNHQIQFNDFTGDYSIAPVSIKCFVQILGAHYGTKQPHGCLDGWISELFGVMLQ